MTIRWITPAGNLGIITERVILEIPLLTTSTSGIVSYSLIAGSLPRGLKLIENFIKGSPAEVRRYTESKFVIRATELDTNGNILNIEDRTFSLAVDGSDEPLWITKEGFLKVGKGNAYFVLDNAYVSFQLDATDTDLTAGDKLEFYLAGGELPPGLSLSRSGLISGFTDPVFAVEYANNPTGAYDTGAYDILPLDVSQAQSNGFDTYLYDNQTFDYNEPSRAPRRISRFYSFIVSVSDGANEVKRLFRIYVVTEEFLKADNSILQVDTNLFQADNTNDRQPIWITESYLGRHRANNYLTIYLDVYDPPSLSGTITYFLLDENPDGSPSSIPPGMELDAITGEIAGRVPYQSAVTKEYKFTMQAVNFPSTLADLDYVLVGDWSATRTYEPAEAVRYNGFIYVCVEKNTGVIPKDGQYWDLGVSTAEKTFTIDIIGEIESSIEWISDSDRGTIKPNQPSRLFVEAKSLLYGGKVIYEIVSGNIPPGLEFLNTGIIQGKVKQFADSLGPGLTRNYDKTLIIGNRTGNILVNQEIRGSTSGAVGIVTDYDLQENKIYYDLYRKEIVAMAEILYKDSTATNFIEGENITVGPALGIVEKLIQEYNTTFDGGDTRFDKKFTFVVKARDTINFAESLKTFYITVIADNTKTFANLYLKAFQHKDKRLYWYDFITNSNIFRTDEIYRYGDPNFGIQTELKVLLFAGIESVGAVNYVQAMSRNHYRKQLKFGDIQTAVAKDPLTQEPIYEVVYIDVVDEYEKDGKSISQTIELPNDINSKILISYNSIKIDSDIPLASQSDHQRVFPNSFKNMRSRIKSIGDRDREFLPLWMRSIQSQSFVETGYVKALVLCYLKPGKSEEVISRIKASGFNFKSLDFTVDRYLIDVLNGEIDNKYLAFPQRGEKLP